MKKEGKEILIIEDEIEFAEVVKLRLELAGYDVKIVEDAYQGNKAIMNSSPDLIILDLMMPVGGGFELLNRTRFNPDKTEIPVIILTGKVIDDDVIQSAKRFNVSAIFSKPYDSDKFMSKVRTLVPQ